ncbi:hypothetical protein PENSPDRAFT_645992 [Peniophora sp. CONT]|nr:hypothetical protein PENSPDRAFT_645992 [Peniophora sp. CONT]
MAETARVRVAVSLAICELKAASAHDELVPMECAAFASEERAEAPDNIDPRACTQAMLRSTQAWASFSGYHRDILPICTAMQHSNGIDRALELFHNATVGNIALIRYFEKRTEEDQVSRESWYDLHHEYRQTTEDLRMLQSHFDVASKAIVGEASELLHTAFISGDALLAHMQARWEKTQEDSLAVYGPELKHVQDTFAGEIVLRSHELAAALDHFSVRFSSLSHDIESQQHLVGATNQALDAASTVSHYQVSSFHVFSVL